LVLAEGLGFKPTLKPNFSATLSFSLSLVIYRVLVWQDTAETSCLTRPRHESQSVHTNESDINYPTRPGI